MRRKVVFDWDGVIFNDDYFKQTLFKSLQSRTGLSFIEIETAYKESKDSNGYNDQRLAGNLAVATGQEASMLLAYIHETFDRVGQALIYDDARELIASLQVEDIVILTAGDARIQEHKITATDMVRFANHIEVVSAENTAWNKEQYLKTLINEGYQVLFYDDKLSTILHTHEAFRDELNFSAVWIDREKHTQAENIFVRRTLSTGSHGEHSAVLGTRRTLSAALRIKSDDGKQLLVQENSGRARGRWTVPLGHVDNGETFLQTALREVQEECGLSVLIDDIYKVLAIEGEEYMGGDRDIGSTVLLVCFDASIQGELEIPAELKSSWVIPKEMEINMLRGAWQPELF